MDYQVGSLADLISAPGSVSTNKKKSPKVVSGGYKIEFQKVETPIAKAVPKKRKSAPTDDPSKKIRKTRDPEGGASANFTNARKRLAKKGVDVGDIPPAKDGEEGTPKMQEKITPKNEEHEKRTIFVGNVPTSTSSLTLKRIFNKYGTVDAVRFRSVPLADIRTTKKVACITKEFHEQRSSINAYIRFVNVEDAHKALKHNGVVFKEHALRVDMASGGDHHNSRHAVFVGNVKFTVEEDDLRKIFQECGQIESVRIVRDAKTGIGKGIAFVNFAGSSSVEMALQLDGTQVEGRAVRVSRYGSQKKPKVRKLNKLNKKGHLKLKYQRKDVDGEGANQTDPSKLNKRGHLKLKYRDVEGEKVEDNTEVSEEFEEESTTKKEKKPKETDFKGQEFVNKRKFKADKKKLKSKRPDKTIIKKKQILSRLHLTPKYTKKDKSKPIE